MNQPLKTSVKAPSHNGNQPIRVLQHNIIHQYENTNATFLKSSKELVDKMGLQPGITYFVYDEAIQFSNEHFGSQTPFVDGNKKIAIHETFLSYIWVMCYSMWVLYDEAVAKPMQNVQAEKEINKINKDLISSAKELLTYGKSLIRVFTPWDKKKLPNPEEFSIDEEFYIFRANGLFTMAINFILCHEFAHVEKEHIDQIMLRPVGSQERKVFEKEADDRAIELMLQGKNGKNDKSIDLGILIGLCSMLYFSESTSGGKHHPDTDVRIVNFLDQINPSNDDPIWGIAGLFFKIWDDQFNLNFVWPTQINDFKELFYNTLKQVEDKKKKS